MNFLSEVLDFAEELLEDTGKMAIRAAAKATPVLADVAISAVKHGGSLTSITKTAIKKRVSVIAGAFAGESGGRSSDSHSDSAQRRDMDLKTIAAPKKRDCGATIRVDNNGYIKWTKPFS